MIEKRLADLEDDVQEIKLMQLELAEKSARLQLLIEQMEQQLDQFEDTVNSEAPEKVNQSELLSVHGFIKPPKQEAGSYEQEAGVYELLSGSSVL
ncbi:hypothetical protein LEAN103870_16970 [Legionella anisa]|uniref:Uncharacterized protein n=1 Tax=Legionella anisa TaxID=28082 RepID=A0AAX0WQ95_9GAMM|nr:hypothetical protein [Legionella anisa]AWN75186.1 hypothetical protein DLD14_15835 [Legionella anisa]KTC66978.1 hypothetical protein Lani_3323 [Legionella anisa]MBN5936591.1 hypothetical protein [Legionella anisa]MCW8424592.1 hypothetical protein [Legionella anisa]MCW8446289.1 hypothetical protein [Legionella anisa]